MEDRKILMIVEDDDCVRSMYRATFKRHYCLEDFPNAASAINKFKQSPQNYGLIITDNRMPNINDGLRMSQEMYEINPAIPIILCSGTLDDLVCQKIPKNIKKVFEKTQNIVDLRNEVAKHYLA